MKDPFGSFNNMMRQFNGFMGNPLQMMVQNKLNVPSNIQKNPSAILQYMMDNGMLSQSQLNQASKMAQQIKSNPQYSQFFKK